ncbi:MAG: YjbF family lipoprotein [Roseobacter sp.]|nr:YjbF family lipoprotein [Roseobacter sp.]
MSFHKRSVALFLILSLALVACGNQPDRGKGLEVVKGLVKKRASVTPAAPSADDLTKGITVALDTTEKPLALAFIEDRRNFTLLTEVSVNSAHSTWASTDRRTLSERHGIIVSSRGLGADLMAAQVSPSLALIRNAHSGRADRTHIYLDGENHEVIIRLSCQIKTHGTEVLSVGEIHSAVTVVSEDCTGDGVTFLNTYKVTSGGRIVQSRQWLGTENGYITVQKLR